MKQTWKRWPLPIATRTEITEKMPIRNSSINLTEWNRWPLPRYWIAVEISCQKLDPEAPNISIIPLSITLNVRREHRLRKGITKPWLRVKEKNHSLLSRMLAFFKGKRIAIVLILHQKILNKIPKELQQKGNNFILRFTNSPSACGSTGIATPQWALAGPAKRSRLTHPTINEATARRKRRPKLTSW